jgi:hypothetical protein
LPKSVDLRSAGGRRFRHLLASYSAELGGELTEADQALLRQAVTLQLEAERQQAAIVRGETVDGDMLIRISSEARRALAALKTKAEKRKPAATGLDRPAATSRFQIPRRRGRRAR